MAITRTSTVLIGWASAVQLTYQEIGLGQRYPSTPVYTDIGAVKKAFLITRVQFPASPFNIVPQLVITPAYDAYGFVTDGFFSIPLLPTPGTVSQILHDITKMVEGYSYVSIQIDGGDGIVPAEFFVAITADVE